MAAENSSFDRRTLFGGLVASALVGGCSSRSGVGTTPDDASVDGPMPGSDGGSPGSDSSADGDAGPDPDLLLLNELLAGEYRLARTYEAVLSNVRDAPDTDPLSAYRVVLVGVLMRWQEHHRAHASALAAAVSGLGGTPVASGSVQFAPPPGYAPSITNALRLTVNVERTAAVAYNETLERFRGAGNRALAANIEGDETQHFATLYALLQSALRPGSALLTGGVTDVVPTAFVSTTGGVPGLQMVADLAYR